MASTYLSGALPEYFQYLSLRLIFDKTGFYFVFHLLKQSQ